MIGIGSDSRLWTLNHSTMLTQGIQSTHETREGENPTKKTVARVSFTDWEKRMKLSKGHLIRDLEVRQFELSVESEHSLERVEPRSISGDIC